MAREKKKAKTGTKPPAEAPPTEPRRSRYAYEWALHLPQSVRPSSSSSIDTDRSVVRQLAWEEPHQDHVLGESDVVHEDETHDSLAVELECEADLMQEGAAKEGLLPDVRWSSQELLAQVSDASRTLTKKCVDALNPDDEVADGVADDMFDPDAVAAMSAETDSLAVMQHVLGQSYMPDSSAAATEAKAAALGLLVGVDDVDPADDHVQRRLLAKHASDPEVRCLPCP
jgi:hypothetical protein